jgi:hypothetical protein
MVEVQVDYCDEFKYTGKQETIAKDEFNDIM